MNEIKDWGQILSSNLGTIPPTKSRKKAKLYPRIIGLLVGLSVAGISTRIDDVLDMYNDQNTPETTFPDYIETIFKNISFNEGKLSEANISALNEAGFELETTHDNQYYFRNRTGFSLSISAESIMMFKDRAHILTLLRENDKYTTTHLIPNL